MYKCKSGNIYRKTAFTGSHNCTSNNTIELLNYIRRDSCPSHYECHLFLNCQRIKAVQSV